MPILDDGAWDADVHHYAPARDLQSATEGDLMDVSDCVTKDAAMPDLILGIDIGRSGAAALLTPMGDLIDVEPLPVLNDGPAGRPAVNAPLLADLVRRWAPGSAFVEYVGARPGEAASGAFSFGRCRGVIEGVLGASGVPTRFLTPPCWKRAVGIKPGKDGAKDAARSEAIRRWPQHAARFAPKGSDGLAEAALIGVAGLMREAAR